MACGAVDGSSILPEGTDYYNLLYSCFFGLIKYMDMNPKQRSITISKKVAIGIVPIIAIVAILISRGSTVSLILFFIGIVLGVFIVKAYLQEK